MLEKGASARREVERAPLMNAAVNGHMAKITLLLGACASDRQHDLQKALYLAIMNMISGLARPTEVATILLGKGADVSARDKKGATPLDSAVTGFQCDQMVQLLIDRGFSCDILHRYLQKYEMA